MTNIDFRGGCKTHIEERESRAYYEVKNGEASNAKMEVVHVSRMSNYYNPWTPKP